MQEILAAASSTEPICVEYLHDELKLYEPFEEVVCRLIECDPQRARVANESGSLALHIACGNIENVSIETLNFIIEHARETLAIPNKFGLLPIHNLCIGSDCVLHTEERKQHQVCCRSILGRLVKSHIGWSAAVAFSPGQSESLHVFARGDVS